MRTRLLAGLLATAGMALSISTPVRADSPAAAKPYLGVMVGPMEKPDQTGAVVHQIEPNSPAAKAEFKKGDVILQCDGKDVKNPEALIGAVTTHKPGDSLKFHIRREGKEKDLQAVLAERPANPMPKLPAEKTSAFLGVWTRPMTAEMKEKLGVKDDKGAVVMQVMPGSPAAKAGIVHNDVITAVNGQAITNSQELRNAVQKIGAGKEATVKFFHGKEMKEAKVKLEASPMGFSGMGDLHKDFPKLLKRFNDEPGLSPEIRKHLEEMQQRFRDLEQKSAPAK